MRTGRGRPTGRCTRPATASATVARGRAGRAEHDAAAARAVDADDAQAPVEAQPVRRRSGLAQVVERRRPAAAMRASAAGAHERPPARDRATARAAASERARRAGEPRRASARRMPFAAAAHGRVVDVRPAARRRARPPSGARGSLAGEQVGGDDRPGRRADELLDRGGSRSPSRRASPASTPPIQRFADRAAGAEHEHVGPLHRRIVAACGRRPAGEHGIPTVRDNVRSYMATSTPRPSPPSAAASARCARRWACRCATSPSAAASARRCSPRSSAARRARRCRSPRASPPAWSCASRSCCASTRTARVTSSAPASAAQRAGRAQRPPLRGPHAAAARPARRALAPRARARRAPPAAPATRRCTSPAAARSRSSSPARVVLALDGERHDAARRRLRHLRRRPAPPLREPRPRARRRFLAVVSRRPAAELSEEPPCPRPCSTRSGPPTRWRPGLIYIDLHLVHEVTSPQAFDGLRLAGRTVRRPDRTLATADHNMPTDGTPVAARIKDELSAACRSQTLERNCAEFGIPVYSLGSDRQGIVHVIGPELGVTQPGMTIVCGDSHTATHGAFGALAFGIGTSEVEHVLATQCLVQRKPKSMRIRYEGELGLRRHRQGPDPRHDRPDGRRRRRRPRRRVRRPGDRGALDGGPHDGLQHDDRGRRPRRHDRARRDDVRLGRGPRARRRATIRRPSRTGASCAPTTARASTSEIVVDAAALSPAGHLGHDARHGRRRSPTRCPSRRTSGDERALRLHGPGGRHADRGDQARPRLHRLLHELPHRRPARRRRGRRGPQGRRPRQRDGRAGLAAGQGAGRGRRASTRSSAPPASTGAAPAARCAWA